MFALGSSSGSCLKAVFSVCIFQYVSSSFLSTSVLDWHYACLQTRNVVETNQCPSAFPFLVVLFVPGPAALAPPCSTRASSLLWMRGSVRAQTHLAGVWLAFGWRLAGVWLLSQGICPAREPGPQASGCTGWLVDVCVGAPRARRRQATMPLVLGIRSRCGIAMPCQLRQWHLARWLINNSNSANTSTEHEHEHQART